jgi:hypothetical protein
MIGKCNFCLVESLKKAYPDSKITVEPHPREYFHEGVDVLRDGVWVCWLAKLPTECHC